MCLDPSTLVLKSDFTWEKIGDISVGDELVGVDENPRCQGSGRKLRKTLVQKVVKRSGKCYRITFDNGKSLICTGEHRWLCRHSMTDYHWRSIDGIGKERIQVGFRIRRIVVDTWVIGGFEDGWMGGMLDGEGSLAKNSRLGGSINISQIEGAVYDRAKQYFESNKYNYRIEIDKAERPSKFGKKPVNKLVLSRADEIIKLIGVTRPTRFLTRDWWVGKKVPQIKSGVYSTIISIESVGDREVIDLQTSTKTFIAEGYISHNSTFAVLDLLDDVLFNPHYAGGIVSYSLEHAQHIYKRIIGHALETIHSSLKPLVGIQTQSAREITFANGSYLRVDTSLRGGSYQSVLVSEFGKTCARSPQKAEEVVTGTLQAVSKEGRVVIESTGEGNEGFFSDMVNSAAARGNAELNELDYKLFFFPWMDQAPEYRMQQKVTYSIELTDYFNKLEKEQSIKIDQEQRYWYAHQRSILGEKVRQEYPSSVSEAFLSSSDAYYYAELIEKAYNSNRCLHTSLYDALLPVYVAMDIGVNDLTVLIFFQVAHGEIRIIDYYEDNNKGTEHYARFMLQDKKYLYHTIFLPHDSTKRGPIQVDNTFERDFRRLFAGTGTRITVLERSDINNGISHAKVKFERCVFALGRVKPLLDHLGKYRKKWSEPQGRYIDEPHADKHDHCADCFRYVCAAVAKIEVIGSAVASDAYLKHKKVVENRRNII